MEKVAYANERTYSTDITGSIGLNTVPSARMDKPGTVRIGASTSDPYDHAFMGVQIAKPLYVNLRQSMQVSSVLEKPQRVYPGMDFKLRLSEEGRYAPEFAIGMDSALGHRRFSSEYVALSKRVNDFDFTAGLGWGRMGSGGQIANPFARLSKHFDRNRDFTSESASTPADWLTGKEMGIFGGVEYFTPIEGLSLKADYGADDYSGETATSDYKKPKPWSIGFNYSPRNWVSFAAGLVGGEKVMARLTFQGGLFDWGGKSYKHTSPGDYTAGSSRTSDGDAAIATAQSDGVKLAETKIEGDTMTGVLALNDTQPAAMQIGRAARSMAAHAGPEIDSITVVPLRGGIRGKGMAFSRRDLDQAMARHQGSPEELWQDVSFKEAPSSIGAVSSDRQYKIFPELGLSVGEEDTSHLYRASIVAEESKHYGHGFFAANSLRFNLRDRLYQIEKIRGIPDTPVRSDIDRFTKPVVALDRSFLSWMTTVRPDVHLALTAGYLEEMYAGAGGEILYRPYQSPFAIGADVWQVYKRDPDSFMNLGLTQNNTVTGHLNLYYDIPDTDITAFANVGRYLGGDIGATTGLQTEFQNGVKVKGYVTATNVSDRDAFGKTTNLYGGVQVSLPLGSVKYIPEGSEARIKVEPMGRDAGQMLDKPVSLYDVTEPTSYRRLGRSWQEVQD